MRVRHPLSVKNRLYPIQVVLRDLAAQENCDGEPYDQMMQSAEYIDYLESRAGSHNLPGPDLLSNEVSILLNELSGIYSFRDAFLFLALPNNLLSGNRPIDLIVSGKETEVYGVIEKIKALSSAQPII